MLSAKYYLLPLYIICYLFDCFTGINGLAVQFRNLSLHYNLSSQFNSPIFITCFTVIGNTQAQVNA